MADAVESWDAADPDLSQLTIKDNAQHSETSRPNGPGLVNSFGPQRYPRHQHADTNSASAPFLDGSIRDALSNTAHRMTVLRFELDIRDFVKTPERQELVFPPSQPPYQRMLAHKTAQYYGLETATAEDGPNMGCVVATRPIQGLSRLPACLADVKLPDSGNRAESPAPSDGGSSAPKVLVRRPGSSGPPQPGSEDSASVSNSEAGARSVQEREQEYHRARARIFGDKAPDAVPAAGATPITEQSSTRQYASGEQADLPQRGPSGDQHPSSGGKKAVLRNREAELRDPDFRRAHSHGRQCYERRHQHVAPHAVYGQQFPDQYGMMAVGTHAQQQQSAFVGLNGVMYPLQQPPLPRMAPAFLSKPLSVNGSQHGHERSGSGGPPELAWHHQQQMSGLPLRPPAFVLQQQMQLQMQMQQAGHGGGRPHDQQQFAYMMPPPFVPGGSPGGPPLQYAAGMQTLPAGYQPGFQILPAGMPGMVPQHYAMAPQYQVPPSMYPFQPSSMPPGGYMPPSGRSSRRSSSGSTSGASRHFRTPSSQQHSPQPQRQLKVQQSPGDVQDTAALKFGDLPPDGVDG